MLTMNEMKMQIKAQHVKDDRQRRIRGYLKSEIGPKSAYVILEIFPDSSKQELEEMAADKLITFVGQGRYTVFK